MEDNNIPLIDLVKKCEPIYRKLHSSFSKSYLSGSDWYVGDSLSLWWSQRQLEPLKFKENKNKLEYICEIVLNYENDTLTK